MKKIILTAAVFAFVANASAQLKVDANGDSRIFQNIYMESASGIFGITVGTTPVTFKVGGLLSGSTGSSNKANVSFGYGAHAAITTGQYNTASGFAALYRATGGSYNTASGYRALYANTTGGSNTAIGSYALAENTTSISNTAIGYGALNYNTTGSENTANGYGALAYNKTAGYNTANGAYTLFNNKTGEYNTAIGYLALYSDTTGSNNTASGHRALYSNRTGSYNTASGGYALYANTTGSYNTAIGRNALHSNTTGSNNTALGYYAEVTGNVTNATAIGYWSTANSNNQVRIGNTGVTSIGGQVGWSTPSDKRAKKNVRADVPGLDFINRLQPVTYNLDLDAMDNLLKIDRTKKRDNEENELPQEWTGIEKIDQTEKSDNEEDEQPQKLVDIEKIEKIKWTKKGGKEEDELPHELTDAEKKAREAREKQLQTGFIAQDVEATAKSIGYDFSGVDVDEAGIYGLRYAEFVVPLVKAVQELSEQNDRLQETVQEHSEQNSRLQETAQELSEQNSRLQAQVTELAELVYSLQEKYAAAESRNENELSPKVQDVASSGASLQQNNPNPFSQSTVIRYTLPQNGNPAQLVVRNAAGQLVRQIPLQPETDSVTIEGGALASGIYYYSLYVGSSLVDTKKMVLTN